MGWFPIIVSAFAEAYGDVAMKQGHPNLLNRKTMLLAPAVGGGNYHWLAAEIPVLSLPAFCCMYMFEATLRECKVEWEKSIVIVSKKTRSNQIRR